MSHSIATKTKKSSRIFALDLMRGYFLLSIILNHLFYFPNIFQILTFKGGLFVSAAEGFFFLSGVVLGIVRGHKLLAQPISYVSKLLLNRAFILYAVYLAVTIGSTLLGWLFFMDNPGLKSGIASSDTSLWTLMWNAATFQYLYGWADYLRLYCLFLVVSPLVMVLLRHGKWWLVLTLSILMWFVTPTTTWPTSVYMQPYTWQLIFFGGMVLGFHWHNISTWWHALSQSKRKLLTTGTVTTALVTLILNLILVFGSKLGPDIYAAVQPIRESISFTHFNKENMPLARILLFLIWFWASFWLFTRFEKPIMKYLGKLLIPLGTNSLYVYIVHAIILFFVHLWISPAGHGGDIWINSLIYTAIVAIIWLMIRYKILFRIIPR